MKKNEKANNRNSKLLQKLVSENTKLKELNQILDKKLDEAVTEIEKLKQKNLGNNLEIVGIKRTKNENLKAIITKMATHLNVKLSDDDITHTFRRELNEKIVVKFNNTEMRNKFYNQTFSTETREKHVLDDPNSPTQNSIIFINQQLTNYNQYIYKKARDLKKQGKIYKVTIKDGIVAIKYTEKSRYKLVYSSNDFENNKNK